MRALIEIVEFGIKLALLCTIPIVLYWIATMNDRKGITATPTASKEPVKEKEVVSIDEEQVQFSLNVKSLVQVLLNDPLSREEVYTAVRTGPVAHTTPIGSALIGQNQYTVYAATNREKQPGDERFIYRTRDGESIRANLKQPVKVENL